MTWRPQKDRGYGPPRPNPLVHPGSPTHRQQACPAPYQACLHHRMVMLATCASSRRQTRSSQVKNATVMLGRVGCFQHLARPLSFLSPGTGAALRAIASHLDPLGVRFGRQEVFSFLRCFRCPPRSVSGSPLRVGGLSTVYSDLSGPALRLLSINMIYSLFYFK